MTPDDVAHLLKAVDTIGEFVAGLLFLAVIRMLLAALVGRLL